MKSNPKKAVEFRHLLSLERSQALKNATAHAADNMKDLLVVGEKLEKAKRKCALMLHVAKEELKAGKAAVKRRMEETVAKHQAKYDSVVETICREIQECNKSVETKVKMAEASRGKARAIAEEFGITKEIWA
ncbi:hypothetical protein GGI21_001269 [Coemansia aciculifera]|nr:hypothetical protein GGI21_001269 [Coemansia aciculifera]